MLCWLAGFITWPWSCSSWTWTASSGVVFSTRRCPWSSSSPSITFRRPPLSAVAAPSALSCCFSMCSSLSWSWCWWYSRSSRTSDQFFAALIDLGSKNPTNSLNKTTSTGMMRWSCPRRREACSCLDCRNARCWISLCWMLWRARRAHRRRWNVQRYSLVVYPSRFHCWTSLEEPTTPSILGCLVYL